MEPKYKKVQKLTGIGYEYFLDNFGTEYWYKDGKLHRTEGPACKKPSGPFACYLNGKLVPADEFEKVLKCPLSELPLHINTPFAPLVKERLKNA